jgi:G:T/U-mismatch repair DNA glycosylase
VIASCEIQGSSDSSIKNVIPNDIEKILTSSAVTEIFINGGVAYGFYTKYLAPKLHRPGIKLPSSSPANAAYSLEKLLTAWHAILQYL